MDVLLEDPVGTAPLVLAEALAAFKKIPLQDAAYLVKRSWGFILVDSPEDEARALVSYLYQQGIKARALLTDQVKILPPPKMIKELSFLQSGVAATLEGGTVETIPRDTPILLSAAGLPLFSTTTTRVTEGPSVGQQAVKWGLLAMGIPLTIGGKKRVVEKKHPTEETIYFLSILMVQPPRRYHIDPQHFSFAFLKELKQYNLFLNFKVLLTELRKRLPLARLNKGATLLLNNEPVSKMGYESMADVEKEVRCLSTLIQ